MESLIFSLYELYNNTKSNIELSLLYLGEFDEELPPGEGNLDWKLFDVLVRKYCDDPFSTFSDEFFSQGLDRAKFGEDTILLEPAGSFSICYLFRGQTYFAKQKLVKFAETLKNEPLIWETLEKFEKTSQVAELRDLPRMEKFLTTIFLS